MTAEPIRVVQWATGAVGAAQLREVVDRPDLELVGLFVYDPAKVGVDAGDAGRPRGRPASPRPTTRTRSSRSTPTSCSTPRARRSPQNTNTDDIVALLESGKSVITTTSYNHLPTYGADADRRIRRALCVRTGTRFHAAGEHPGFMFERLGHVGHRAVADASTGSRCRSSSTAPACRARRCSST